jgi:uncharacterized protein involved in exopolysaccharide biosynthesis
VDPLRPIVTEEGKTVMNPSERLKYLRMELISLKGSLSDKHPDVKKLKKQIKELEAEAGRPDYSVDKVRRLNDLEGQLASLKGKLGPKHPDVIKISNEVKVLSREIEDLKTMDFSREISEQKPDNPAYIHIKTQTASTELMIEGLLKEKKEIEKNILEYRKRIENAPLLEKEYNNLMRDYENARFKYDEISRKLMEAKVAQGMEETQRGERFTIIEAAGLPEKPHKPNRVAIIMITFVLALGAGVGIAAVRESLDHSLKTAEEISRNTGLPVLSVLPFMETGEERRARKIKWIVIFLGVIGVIVLALFIFDQFVMPLDVLWAKMQRKFDRMAVL